MAVDTGRLESMFEEVQCLSCHDACFFVTFPTFRSFSMPSILKVRIINARDLPVMDRSTDLTDAFVEIRFGSLEPHRTAIARRTLSPVWNEVRSYLIHQDFRFEVNNDCDLQNEPLEIKVLDYDYVSSNDAIGSVFIDITSLLSSSFSPDSSNVKDNSQISGYFPIYDNLRGIRGEIQVFLSSTE